MRKNTMPWYLSVWFIFILTFISTEFLPLVIIPVILTLFHIKQLKKITASSKTLESLRNNGFNEGVELTELIEKQKVELSKIESEISEKNNSINKINEDLTNLKNEYIETEDLVLMQDFGFYNPKYDLVNSTAYKTRLDSIREQQKSLVKTQKAVSFNPNWTVNGSKSEGKKMIKDTINLAIRSFNNECDTTISKVTVANIEASEKRIKKAFETINKLNRTNGTFIQNQYLNLKLEELYLALEYANKVEEEKEEQRQLREQMKEEEKVRKEIEKLKQKIEKEETHFSNAIQNLKKQLETADEKLVSELESKIIELQEKLNEVSKQKEDVLNRERNTRAGYVYIISNVGSFGENVYKIGMTRRLEPMDRVRELGDASVPFKFDVHALIFSEDAPSLENVLHKTFNHRRLNLINERKEFFNVDLEEIRNVVEKNHDKTIEFTMTSLAEEYRESLALKSKIPETVEV